MSTVKLTVEERVLLCVLSSFVLLLALSFYTTAILETADGRVAKRIESAVEGFTTSNDVLRIVSKTKTNNPTFDDMFMFVVIFVGLLSFALIMYLHNLSVELTEDRERVKKLIESIEEREE